MKVAVLGEIGKNEIIRLSRKEPKDPIYKVLEDR